MRDIECHRFNVFGDIVAIQGSPGGWVAWLVGADGKRRPADFIVPGFLAREELCEYLADLFHESATPWNGSVFEIE